MCVLEGKEGRKSHAVTPIQGVWQQVGREEGSCDEDCTRTGCSFNSLCATKQEHLLIWGGGHLQVLEKSIITLLFGSDLCNLCLCAEDLLEDQSDFLVVPRNQELLGDQAKHCDISVSIEKTGLEDRKQYTLSYVLFRCVNQCELQTESVFDMWHMFKCVNCFLAGVLLQTSSRAAVGMKLSSTPYSCTRSSPVSTALWDTDTPSHRVPTHSQCEIIYVAGAIIFTID